MEQFFELVADFYKDAHRDMVQGKGHEPWQFNVFIDLETEKLFFQYACRDEEGEHVASENQPNKEDFKVFKHAYDGLKEKMKEEGHRVEFSDIISLMEHMTVIDLAMYGYDKNVHFSIGYIPIEQDLSFAGIANEK